MSDGQNAFKAALFWFAGPEGPARGVSKNHFVVAEVSTFDNDRILGANFLGVLKEVD